jgi:hypothetical protein
VYYFDVPVFRRGWLLTSRSPVRYIHPVPPPLSFCPRRRIWSLFRNFLSPSIFVLARRVPAAIPYAIAPDSCTNPDALLSKSISRARKKVGRTPFTGRSLFLLTRTERMVAAKTSDDFSRYATRRIGTGRERVRSVACEFNRVRRAASLRQFDPALKWSSDWSALIIATPLGREPRRAAVGDGWNGQGHPGLPSRQG